MYKVRTKTPKEKAIDILIVFIMVFIMVIYNSLWRRALTPQTIKRLLLVYPIIVMTVLTLRTFVSMPIARLFHKKSNFFKPQHFHVTMPVMVINMNAVMVGGLSTYFFHNYHTGQFFEDYLLNITRSLIFSLPLYFIFIAPLSKRVKNWLRVEMPIK